MDMKNIEILDSNETGTLYRLKNDIFDSVAFEAPDGEMYFPKDMQGAFPTSLEEVPNYDWVTKEDWLL